MASKYHRIYEMKKYLLLFLIIPFCSISQNDTIYKKGGKIIICTITNVNEKTIMYKDKGGYADFIELSKVERYSHEGKNTSTSECFPTNKTNGQIEIKGKVLIGGKSKDEIFNKVIVWATSKSSNDNKESNEEFVKDKEASIVKLHSKINYTYKDGLRTIFYAISVQVNNGSLEYIVNDFMMNKKPMEVYLKDKEDENYRIAFADICKKMNNTLDELKQLK